MAVELSKYSGSGNATITASNTNEVYTGREDKTTTFKGLTSKGVSATIKVIEKSIRVFDLNNTSLTINSQEHSLIISGISNAQGIRIFGGSNIIDQSQGLTLIDNNISINVPWQTDRLNIVAYNNNDSFGKNNKYEFQFVINIPKNLTISQQSYHLYIAPYYTDTGLDLENEKELWIDQEAGNAYCYVNLDGSSETSNVEAIMTQEGTPLNFYIMSNTQWNITNE